MHGQMQAPPLMQMQSLNLLRTATNMHAMLHMVHMQSEKLQVPQTLLVVQQPPKAVGTVPTPPCLPCTGPKKARSMGPERMSTME
jgi:hypothetical protein